VHLGVDQTLNPKFAKHPLVEENKMIESSMTTLCEMLKIKHILIRASFTFDHLAHWFAEDIQNGALQFPPKTTSTFIAMSDLAECTAKVVLDPKKYSNQTLTLYENAYALEDLTWSIALTLGSNLSFQSTPKDKFKEVLSKAGFSEQFSGTLSRIFCDFSVSCSDIPTSDVAAKVLQRSPLNLVQWAEQNEHLFR